VSNTITGLEPDVIRDLLDRLNAMGVSIRERRNRLIVKGQPGFERDAAVQSLVARLRGYHAEDPEGVVEVLRQGDGR
jgi:hypothetical protein